MIFIYTVLKFELKFILNKFLKVSVVEKLPYFGIDQKTEPDLFHLDLNPPFHKKNRSMDNMQKITEPLPE